MSGFSTAWLAMREPADRRARDPAMLCAVADFLSRDETPLVVDLGCGTGALQRALAPYLTRPVRFRLVDDEPALLAEAEMRSSVPIELVRADLTLDLSAIAGARLVTASALLDLVSEAWLDRLVAGIAAAKAGFYAPLCYDGRIEWQPTHPLDDAIHAAFDRHQLSDKGFGPAAGPEAAASVAARFRGIGHSVSVAESPWQLDRADNALIAELARGIARAAGEIGGLPSAAIEDWLAFRLAHAEEGGLVIGHKDVLALPVGC